MPNVVLGVSGSIAAYRAADLARELMRAGNTVRVCLTDSAQQFVTPILFETLTGQPCLQDTFEEPERGRMAHIDWARQADLLVVAPATSTTLARLALGIGEDMLSTIALAYEGPLVLAPAMNPTMFAAASTQEHLHVLRSRGARIVDPIEGDVVAGETGPGKMALIPNLVAAIQEVLQVRKRLTGKHVVITSGPTREPIDGVRYLSNRSSGRMGVALAQAALWMGARVTLVTGPTALALPLRAEVHRVETALQMQEALRTVLTTADVVIGAAAVADYRVAEPLAGKRRRSEEPWTLQLVPNPDLIADAAGRAPQARVVGFAAEPSEDLSVVREKLVRKGLYAIAANDVSRADIGFDAEENELRLVLGSGEVLESGKQSKLGCALWLLEILSR